ncbi:hypothetical protein ACLOJK_013551 [Asimina triloba]
MSSRKAIIKHETKRYLRKGSGWWDCAHPVLTRDDDDDDDEDDDDEGLRLERPRLRTQKAGTEGRRNRNGEGREKAALQPQLLPTNAILALPRTHIFAPHFSCSQ